MLLTDRIMAVFVALVMVTMTATNVTVNGQSGNTPRDSQQQRDSQSGTMQQPAALSGLLTSLPRSDAMMYVDTQRLFTDVLPRTTESDQGRLAGINADIERFKTRTGIDVRSFDRIALSLRFRPRLRSLFPPEGTLQVNPVVIAQGRFNSNQILDAARRATQTASGSGRVPAQGRESRHKGKPVYTVRIDDDVRVFGLFDLSERELSVSALDDGTIAIGKPETVRAAIDAATGDNRVDAELVRLASAQPAALMGFAGRVPGVVAQRIEFGTRELSRPFRELRGFYGSLAETDTGFALLTNLQTSGDTAAAELSRMINALGTFIPGLIAQLPAIVGRAAGVALRRVGDASVDARGSEVAIRVELAPDAGAARAGKK